MALIESFSKSQLEQYSTVEDDELNSLLQEVRNKFDNKYFLQEETLITNKWFKTTEKTLYKLIHEKDNGLYEVINFNKYNSDGRNMFTDKLYIETAFNNLLKGYEYGREISPDNL
ncbi:MAG: hypothetical protein ABIB43_05215 [archaeon]